MSDLGDPTQEHRRAREGLFAGSRRAGPGEGRDAQRAGANGRERAEKALGAGAVGCRDRPLARRWRRRLAFRQCQPTAPIASTPPAEAAHLSIVVLPFANLSGDPAQDYFADGITENLTTDLSRIRNSFVIARNTAFTFKGKTVDAKEIGKELGVRYVLEGSVQRDQNRVRVNAQLIDAESGAHLWADRFEEDVADLFKLQDQVVARLANTLGIELVKAEAEKGDRSQTPTRSISPCADRALQMHAQERTKENNRAARAMFEQALAIDPNDAGALAGEATTYLFDKAFGWAEPVVDYNAKVIGLADRSIAIAPEEARPYSTKSIYLSRRKPSCRGPSRSRRRARCQSK